MNKIIIGAALISAICAGCKTMPTTDYISKVGTAAGYTTAYVLNKQVNITNVTTRAVIRDVVTKIDNYLPATNETCSAKWNPMIKDLTDKYVEAKYITQYQADTIVKDFNAVTKMLDKYIERKGIRPYQDLVDAFVHSFSTTFLQNFKSTKAVGFGAYDINKCDAEMYDFLMTNTK